MSELQSDFLDTLRGLAPEGITPRVKSQWANTGVIYYQDGDFQTVLAVSYDFQDGYASFNLTETTEDERTAIEARSTASKPSEQGFTWFGWGYVQYAKGELRMVRDGVAHLLNTRTGVDK